MNDWNNSAGYGRFVADGLGVRRQEEFHRGNHEGRLLGDDDFISQVLTKAEAQIGRPPRLPAIVAAVCREGDLPEATMHAAGRGSQAARARWLVGLLAMDLKSANLTEVARYFGREVATMSNGVRQLRELSNEDKPFRQRVARLAKWLSENKISKA